VALENQGLDPGVDGRDPLACAASSVGTATHEVTEIPFIKVGTEKSADIETHCNVSRRA
jgi:hypothetical protein